MKKPLAITSAIAARLLSAVNYKTAIAGLLAASIAAASAASYSTSTTNVVDPNNLAFTAATGNSDSYTTFTNNLANGFATNNAGVWTFDGASFTVNSGETITLSYGTSQASNLVLTTAFGSGDGIGQSSGTPPASGGNFFAENGSAAARSFTPNKPLQTVSIFNLNRGDSSRTAVLMVTFLDNTTASTSGGNGGGVYFHELSASSVTNPIVKFTIQNSALNRWDDLAFIVAPPIVLPPPLWATATNSTSANSVGFNFLNATGPGMDNGQPASLAQSETAGVPSYAQANWNNLTKSGATFTGNFTLTNSLGAPTPLIIDWAGNSTGSSGSASGLGTSDGKLMDGFLGGSSTTDPVSTNVISSAGTAKPLVYLTGLQAWYQAQGAEGFGVVVYENDDPYYDTSVAWVQSVTGSPTNNTMAGGSDLTPRLYNTHSALFNGTYTQIPNTATNPGSSYGANYCVFSGLTNNAVLIRTGDTNESWGGGPLNGFQIVPVFPTMPTAGTPTISPSSTVFAGVPVTLTEVAMGDPVKPQLWYQWQSDNGSGGAVNNNILNATNATYAFTPTNSSSTYYLQFQVIVTNVFGAAVSSVVTLTVNPAVAPYVTTDTAPGAGSGMSAVYAYVNGSVTFNAAFGGTLPITNQWQADTGSGYASLTLATNTTLTVTNLQLASSGNYRLYASNPIGNNSSTPAALTVQPDPAAPDASEAYAYAVSTNSPYAYWRFSETIDSTAGNSVQAYDYSGHNFNATYGNLAFDGDAGPSQFSTPACLGFEDTNTAVTLYNGSANSWLNVPSLNLNTNTVTITAWINPGQNIGTRWGLFMWRGTNGDAAGFGFGGNSSSGMAELGYVWNTNSSSTLNFHSGLYAPVGQWSFVSLTIAPTNTSIYLYYTDGSGTHLSKAVQAITNSPEAFSGGTIRIGSDNSQGRNFAGSMDEVAVFNKTLSEAQLQGLFLTGSGSLGVPAYIATDISATPTNATVLFPGQVPMQLTVVGAGAPSPAYQWQAGSGGVFANLSNSGSYSGVKSGTLTINPVTPATYLDYQVVVTDAYGSATSSVYTVQMAIVPTNGLWTACYQFTNASGFLWYNAYGSGSYSGPGVLGHGGFWNPIPGGGQWAGGSFTSVSDYMDNGSTHSGVNCSFNNAGFSIAAASAAYPPTDHAGLLSQFAYYLPGVGVTVPNAMTISLPNGIYNLAFHADDLGWGSVGTIFTVHGANGDQSDTTINTGQSTYFINQDTSVVITNVQVANGVLNVDAAPSSPSKGEFAINAVEIQIVSYAPPTAGFSASPTDVFVNQTVTFVNAATPVTNLFWNFGDGNTMNTAVNGNVTHAYSTPGTYTVSQTVKNQGGTASVTQTAYITVLSKPVIGSATMSAGSFVLNGTGGISGQQYRILTSTNLALPLASWTTAATSAFATDGSYGYTNSTPTGPAGFYIMVSP